eukprot:124003-Chlamydomonas_euryale.AAC.12
MEKQATASRDERERRALPANQPPLSVLGPETSGVRWRTGRERSTVVSGAGRAWHSSNTRVQYLTLAHRTGSRFCRRRFVQAELMHCRWAMMGVAGILFTSVRSG